MTSKFVFALGLAFQSGESLSNLQSGFDSQGSQVPIVFSWSNGASTGTRSTVIVETTSLLEVHAGQQVVVKA